MVIELGIQISDEIMDNLWKINYEKDDLINVYNDWPVLTKSST